MNLEEMLPPEELDVQKAVVESLAEDKAALTEKLAATELKVNQLESKINELNGKLVATEELIAKNTESTLSNQVSLLDRCLELADRFEGETRDHVLEAIRAGRDQAEKDGRVRCAQVLEAVLVANEPSGNLAAKRAELTQLFEANANVINGTVIETLKKMGLSHKQGEDYLLAKEIMLRNF